VVAPFQLWRSGPVRESGTIKLRTINMDSNRFLGGFHGKFRKGAKGTRVGTFGYMGEKRLSACRTNFCAKRSMTRRA